MAAVPEALARHNVSSGTSTSHAAINGADPGAAQLRVDVATMCAQWIFPRGMTVATGYMTLGRKS